MSQRIRLRDLRYYVLTGAILGGINALFAFGPKLIRSFSSDGPAALWYGGPLVPYWLPKLIYFPIGVAMFALIGVLVALPAGYFQLWRFRRRLHPRRAKQGRSVALALAEPPDPRRSEARASQPRLPRS